MTTLQTTSKPKREAPRKVSRGDMAYACLRYQSQVHNLLIKTIKEADLSQKELAEITGIDEATISRLLRRPRNMEINTLSKLVFGAVGATLTVALAYPQTGRSVMLVSAANSAANVAAEARKNDTRRFVFESIRLDTPLGIASASSDGVIFDKVAVIPSEIGRVRKVDHARD